MISLKSGSSIYEILCNCILGFGQMCMFTGYNTQSFVIESVLHSINERSPEVISTFAGYYGQAVMYLVYTVSNLFAPAFLHLLGPKWTIFIGSTTMTIYYVGFFHLNQYFFYFGCGISGLGFAMYYAGQGTYITSHSSINTISRNSTLVWSISSGCMIVGAGLLALIFSFGETPSQLDFTGIGNGTISKKPFRTYENHEVMILFSSFTLIAIISNIIFVSLPKRETYDSLSSSSELRWEGFRKHLGEQIITCLEPKVLFLAPLFLHWGMFTSFWIGIYPTTLTFTKSLTGYIYLPAIYSVSLGIGEIVAGLFLSFSSRRYPSFGLRPTMFLCYFLTIILFIFVAISTPNESTFEPTEVEAVWIQPSIFSISFIGFLLGSVDACLSTARSVICALILPHRRSHVFSSGKFYQSLSGCLLFFFSPKLDVFEYLTIMSISLTLALGGFWKASSDCQIQPNDEEKPKEICSEEYGK